MNPLLTPDQEAAVSHFTESGGGMCWWKVGEGKTRIAIFWYLAMMQKMNWLTGGLCLVVCRRKAFRDWYDEIKLCLPNSMVFEEDAPFQLPRGKQCFMLVSEGKIAALQTSIFRHNIHAIVEDEGWLFANHKSKKSRAIQALGRMRPSLLLSGTLMKARDSLELYSQAMAVNKHKHCSQSPTKFRTEFQICQRFTGFPSYHPKPGAYAKILHRFRKVSHIHFPSGRRQINQFHNVTATLQQEKLFEELREFYSATGDTFELEYDNTLAIIAKAQQISSGFIKDKEGKIHTIASNKPEKLRDELESIVYGGEKCVVWCAFRHDLKLLADFLPFATVQMCGGEEFDLDRWKHPDTTVCLATEASGSSVNYFAQVRTAIYYSANFKWKDMQQSRGRTDRKSSSHTDCYYKYLQVDGSLDSHVYQTALDSGESESSLVQIQKRIVGWVHPLK